MGELDTLIDWCEEYRGDAKRLDPRTVRCEFGMNTFVEVTKDLGRLTGKANVEYEGRPQVFSGPVEIDEDLGMYTIVVDGVRVDLKEAGGETVASGYRPPGGVSL